MVEQGTENPRVGGSNPSLATTLVPLFLALGAAGCGQDDCEQLCTRMARELSRCLAEWPADWSDLDASGRADWLNDCADGWASVRAELETRELEDALDQCAEADAALADARAKGRACDVLRPLVLDR